MSTTPPQAPLDRTLLENIKTILRDDLKLGPNAVIPDDMPLIGGPADLDSIDVLLLVSTIEKKFGFKVPNEAVGRSAFESVEALTRFVQANRDASAGAATAATTPQQDWLAKLPHGPEFRFVSSVRDVKPGESAVAVWDVRGGEEFLKGHFPGRPLVPGVLITEALAQAAGLAAASEAKGGMLAHVDMRFLAPVIPPATIELHASVKGTLDRARLCEVEAIVAGKVVARGTLAIHLQDQGV
jgi:3-hydroxyacyl-[acyl-carrier-protein] dehydratase